MKYTTHDDLWSSLWKPAARCLAACVLFALGWWMRSFTVSRALTAGSKESVPASQVVTAARLVRQSENLPPTKSTVAPLPPPARNVADSSSSFPSREEEQERLRNGPKADFAFDKADLSELLEQLANKAGMSYVLPSEMAATLVTMNLPDTSPFTALETVANAYGTALIYSEGVWVFRPFDDRQPVANSYEIELLSGQWRDSLLQNLTAILRVEAESGVSGSCNYDANTGKVFIVGSPQQQQFAEAYMRSVAPKKAR
jgi:hypothetical protein